MQSNEAQTADRQPPRARHFDAASMEEAKQWQAQCRRGLAAGLGLSGFLEKRADAAAGRPDVPLNARITGTEDMGHSTFFKMTFDVTPDWTADAFLTVPKKGERFPAVVCVHAVKEDIYPQTEYCIWPYAEKRTQEGWQPYGPALAEGGNITITADFGVPAADVPDRENTNGAERVQIGMRLVDWLCTRDDVDTGRIGTVGICRWAGAACHLAVFDPRINVVVTACTLIRDQNGVPWPSRAGTGQPPFDLLDLYGLIAPRPVLCQFGEVDPLRPGYPTEAEIDEVRRRHAMLGGRPADIEVLWHPGGHVVDPGSLPGFFERANATTRTGDSTEKETRDE